MTQTFNFLSFQNPSSSVYVLRLEVNFVLPLSQDEQEQEEEEEPATKYLSCYRPDFDQTLNVGT